MNDKRKLIEELVLISKHLSDAQERIDVLFEAILDSLEE